MVMQLRTPLFPLVKRYLERHPVDAAHMFETLNDDEAVQVLENLPSKLAAILIQYIPSSLTASVFLKLPKQKIKNIVEYLESHQTAAIFLCLPGQEREFFLHHLSEDKKKAVREILIYPESSAGRIMSTQYLSFHNDMKVRHVVQRLRRGNHKADSYAYVIDNDNKLIGIVSMHDLLLATADTALESIAKKDIFCVDCFTDAEKVAYELNKRKYFVVPVVDYEKHLLGVIKADRLLGEVQQEAAEDIQKIFGATGDERAFSPLGFKLKTRLPWLVINLATAFLAASVVSMFESVIARITVLAVYLPVIAGQGGNAGAQSLAVVMRGLVMREIPLQKARRLIFYEMATGIINGFILGMLTAGIAWIWHSNAFLGLVVGLGMMTNLTIAGFSGAAVPLTMKKMGFDPAQCSNIILTTITDVMGFLTFLGLAVLFQKYL